MVHIKKILKKKIPKNQNPDLCYPSLAIHSEDLIVF